MLRRPKTTIYETLDEANFYAATTVPKMHLDVAAVTPLVLEVPLFAITRRKATVKDKAVLEPKAIVNAVWSKKGRGYLRYTGPQLTQSHLTVLLTLINLRAGQVVSNLFEFRPSAMLAAMGWSDRLENIVRLAELLDDLKCGQVRLWLDGQNEQGEALRVSFVSEFQPAQAANWNVCLSSHLLPIFAGHLTRLSLPFRKELREGLATFLYGYLEANNGALPVMFEDLHKACGSGTANLSEFAKATKKALAQLQQRGIIKGIKPVRGGFRFFK